MNKASSLLVLILLGSLVADAVAQTNPRGPGYKPPGGSPAQPQQPQQPQIPQQQPQQPQQPAQPLPQIPQQQPQQPQQPAQPLPQYPQQPVQQWPQQQPQQPARPLPSNGMGQVITERLYQSIRIGERLRISEVLRLSMMESRELEVVSISVSGQALRNQSQIDILSRGRLIVGAQILRRQLTEARFFMPAMTRIDDLEISVTDESILDSISVEVRRSQDQRLYQVASGQLLTLSVNQNIRISGEIALRQLVQQQLGLSLEGAQIERVVVQAQVARGRSASLEIEMNNRLMAYRAVSAVASQTPIVLNSVEAISGNFRLIVRGDVVITNIMIRVGQVRPIRY